MKARNLSVGALVLVAAIGCAGGVCAAVEGASGAIFGTPVTVAAKPERAMALAMEGTRLYTGAKDVVAVYETADDPLHPRLLGSIKLPFGLAARQLAVQRGIAYMSAREHQMLIVDCRDPAKMELLSRYDCCELATGIDVAGDVCFLGQRQNGVEFIDVRDPRHPAHIAMRKTDESQSVFYRDGFCYSGDWGTGKLTVFDCHDMKAIRQTAYEHLYGFGDGIYPKGRYLYCSTGHNSVNRPTEGLKTIEDPDYIRYHGKTPGMGAGHGLDVFDIADPAHPKRLGRVDFPPFYKRGLDMWTPRPSGEDGIVFSAQTHNGLFAVDVSDPTHPKSLDRIVFPNAQSKDGSADCVGSVAVGDGVVYAAVNGQGVVAIPAKRAKRYQPERGVLPKNASYRETYPNNDARFACWLPPVRGQLRGAAAYGDVAFAAAGDAGLYAIELKGSKFGNSRRIETVDHCYDVAIQGNLLVTAEGGTGFGFYRVNADATLAPLTKLPKILPYNERDYGFWVKFVGKDLLALSARTGDYVLFSTAKPDAPKKLSNFPRKCPGWDRYLGETAGSNFLGYSKAHHCIAWVDLAASVGKRKAVVRETEPCNSISLTCGLCAFRDKELIVSKAGYNLVTPGEIANPKTSDGHWTYTPFPVKRFDGMPRTDGRFLALTSRIHRKVALYDFADPAKPKFLWYEQVSGNPEAATFANGRVLIPCSFQGLLLAPCKP